MIKFVANWFFDLCFCKNIGDEMGQDEFASTFPHHELTSIQVDLVRAYWQVDVERDGCILQEDGNVFFTRVSGLQFLGGYLAAANAFYEGVLISQIVAAHDAIGIAEGLSVESVVVEEGSEHSSDLAKDGGSYFDDDDDFEPY